MQDLPSTGVGLLFVCFQASIANQFAFMQRSWADTEAFLIGGTGVDPVIGQVPGGGPAPIAQQWPKQWGQAGTVQPFSFGQFVTLKGGEFFFAPSIAFLKSSRGPRGRYRQPPWPDGTGTGFGDRQVKSRTDTIGGRPAQPHPGDR